METNIRSIVKAISWRMTGTCSTFLIAYIFLGNLGTASSIASLQLVINTILYYFHERGWNMVKWGKSL